MISTNHKSVFQCLRTNLQTAYEVVIIGGGPAGLLTAKRLSEKGINALILEGSRIGGRVKTVKYSTADGKSIIKEHGAEFFSDTDEEVKRISKELRLPKKWSYSREQLAPVPAFLIDTIRYTENDIVKAILPKLRHVHLRGKKLEDISLEKFVSELELPEFSKRAIKKIIELEYGESSNKLPASLIIGLVANIEGSNNLFNKGYESFTLLNGNEELTQALYSSRDNHKDLAKVGVTVTAITVQEDNFFKISLLKNGTNSDIYAKNIVSAMPPEDLARIELNIPTSDKFKTAISSMKNGRHLSAHIIFKEPVKSSLFGPENRNKSSVIYTEHGAIWTERHSKSSEFRSIRILGLDETRDFLAKIQSGDPAAINELSNILKIPSIQIAQINCTDWTESGGSYPREIIGGTNKLRPHLVAQPNKKINFFLAGNATHVPHTYEKSSDRVGFLNSSLQSVNPVVHLLLREYGLS